MAWIGPAIGSFAATLRASSRFRSRQAFERWQKVELDRWLARDLPKAGFYAGRAERLEGLPVTDKAMLMARFDAFNIHGITAREAWAAIEQGHGRDGLTFGMSTGTSGNRGLFVISEAEKYRWLGAMLAKAVPDFWWHRDRVAVVLPQNTALYDSANASGGVRLQFFDTHAGPDAWRVDIEAFAPTIIVAQPSILRYFAERAFALRPRKVFSAAETLDPPDRVIIEAHFQQVLHQIYMATEGLLGVTCKHGTLHLAEDSVFFEFEPAGDGLVSPLITCFKRRTQIMARYRMNDLLRLSAKPCACGSPLRAVDEVVGRMDDVLVFGGSVMITPDVVRNTVLDADRSINDFRVVQTSAGRVELLLAADTSAAVARRAETALSQMFAGRGAEVSVTVERGDLQTRHGAKLRRVQKQC